MSQDLIQCYFCNIIHRYFLLFFIFFKFEKMDIAFFLNSKNTSFRDIFERFKSFFFLIQLNCTYFELSRYLNFEVSLIKVADLRKKSIFSTKFDSLQKSIDFLIINARYGPVGIVLKLTKSL